MGNSLSEYQQLVKNVEHSYSKHKFLNEKSLYKEFDDIIKELRLYYSLAVCYNDDSKNLNDKKNERKFTYLISEIQYKINHVEVLQEQFCKLPDY